MTRERFSLGYFRSAFLEDQDGTDPDGSTEREEHIMVKGYLVDPDQLGEREVLELVSRLDRRARRIAA